MPPSIMFTVILSISSSLHLSRTTGLHRKVKEGDESVTVASRGLLLSNWHCAIIPMNYKNINILTLDIDIAFTFTFHLILLRMGGYEWGFACRVGL